MIFRKHTLSLLAAPASLFAHGVHADSSAKLRGASINIASAGNRILTPVMSAPDIDPCSKGVDGFLNFQCDGTEKFHYCVGARSVAVMDCPDGTACQCGPYDLTSSAPCGSASSLSACEPPTGPPKYSLIDQRKTFDEARVYCRSYGSELASIADGGDNEAVMDLCEGATTKGGDDFNVCWIGLSRTESRDDPETALEWVDGSTYAYRKWNPMYSRPNLVDPATLGDGTVICGLRDVYYYSGTWQFKEKDETFAFICGGDVPDER